MAAATCDKFVVGVSGVGGHLVVCVFFRGAGAVRDLLSFPTRRSSDLVAGDQAAFGCRAALVVIELEGDRAADVFAEGAGQGGLVLEGRADDARGRVLGGFDRGRGLADRHRLVGAARDGFFVVGVAGVGGHPVVGVGGGGAGAVGGFVFAVGGHVDGAVAGDQAAFGCRGAEVHMSEQEERGADVFGDGVEQGGVVLDGRADASRVRVLGGFVRGRGLAARERFAVSLHDALSIFGVAGVGGHPVVGVGGGGAGAVGGFVFAVGGHVDGAVAGDQAAFGCR